MDSFLCGMASITPNYPQLPNYPKGGLICQPENILNEVCYEAGLNEMIAQGEILPPCCVLLNICQDILIQCFQIPVLTDGFDDASENV